MDKERVKKKFFTTFFYFPKLLLFAENLMTRLLMDELFSPCYFFFLNLGLRYAIFSRDYLSLFRDKVKCSLCVEVCYLIHRHWLSFINPFFFLILWKQN
jgi:hypothetical protein